MFIAAPLVAVQAVLSAEDTPVGISTVSFFQMFGGAFFSAISQTIFNEQLVKQLIKHAPGVDVLKLIVGGTTAVRRNTPPEQLAGVLLAYNNALLAPFYLGAAIAATAFLCAWGLEWVNVKGKNLLASEA